jgi:hypothetical protein
MKTIYKYQIEVKHNFSLILPAKAEILTVQMQNATPYIWVLADLKISSEERFFEVFGTGHEIPYDMGIDRKYIGTFQMMGGSLIFHLFERLN